MTEATTTHSTEETRSLARKVAAAIRPGTTVCLSGDLGAGKTTFAQGLLEALGAEKPYTSPTFVIMKQYDLTNASNGISRIYHVDAYRVKEKDLASLGFVEWCADPDGLVILEWPEHLPNLLPKKAWRIHFIWKSETEREISVEQGS